MSNNVVSLRENTRFRFPEQYSPADRNLFGGRDTDIDRLCAQTLDTSCLLFHGRGGAGKTSMIQVGLLAALRSQGWTPVYLSNYQYPIQDFLEALNRSLEKRMRYVLPENGKLTINHIVNHLIQVTRQKKLVFIFDQFENIYSKFQQPNPLVEKFTHLLNSIMLASDNNIRLLFVAKDEYLKSIYQLGLNLPRGARHRYQLSDLDQQAAAQAIRQPLQSCGIEVEEALITETVKSLSRFDFLPFFIRILYNELIDLAMVQDSRYPLLKLEHWQSLGGLDGIICKQLDLVASHNRQVQTSIISGIFATLVDERNKGEQTVISDLKNSLVLADEKDTFAALQALIKSGFIKSFAYDSNQGRRIFKHLLIHQNLSSLIIEWLGNKTDNKQYEAIRKIISATIAADIWQHNNSAYLSYDQLQKLDTSYQQRLSLTNKELQFLFESAVYHHSPFLYFLAYRYGQARVLDHLKKCLRSHNENMRVRAAQAVTELGKQGMLLKPLATQLLDIALSKQSYELRKACGCALAYVYDDSHVVRLKQETRSIRFHILRFTWSIMFFILNQFRSEMRNLFDAKNTAERAQDVLVCFYSEGVSLQSFRSLLRRRAANIWLKRQINEKRRELHGWIYQGRLVGISSALNWYFTFGLLLMIVVSNVFYLDKYRSFGFNLGFALCGLIPLIVAGLFFGRSMAKTAFVKYEIKKKRNISLFIFRNPLYIGFLIFFVVAAMVIFNQAKIEKVAYFLAGPIFFWLLIPFMVQFLNEVDTGHMQHRRMVQGKAYFGATVLLMLGLACGLLLNRYFSDSDLFYYFLIVGGTTSAIFMMIYTSINFQINRIKPVSTHYKQWQDNVSQVLNGGLVILSILSLGGLFSGLYGQEALFGPWQAQSMNLNKDASLLSASGHYDSGPHDANYYQFKLAGEEAYLMRIPERDGAGESQHLNTQLLIDGHRKIDMHYSLGESFIIPPGRRFLVARNGGKKNQAANRALSFAFQVKHIPGAGSLPGRAVIQKALPINKNRSHDLDARLVNWHREPGRHYWFTDIEVESTDVSKPLALRLLKNLYSLQTTHSLAAQITTQLPELDTAPVNVSIIKPESLEQIPADRFYYAEPENFGLDKVDGKTILRLYLNGKNMSAEADDFKSVVFLDLSIKH